MAGTRRIAVVKAVESGPAEGPNREGAGSRGGGKPMSDRESVRSALSGLLEQLAAGEG
jgi:hypothetical protein